MSEGGFLLLITTSSERLALAIQSSHTLSTSMVDCVGLMITHTEPSSGKAGNARSLVNVLSSSPLMALES